MGVARTDSVWTQLNDHVSALHQLAMEEVTWHEAAQIGFQLRRQGVTVPFTDLVIGAVAITSGSVLLHRDRHFDMMADHVPLQVESYLV